MFTRSPGIKALKPGSRSDSHNLFSEMKPFWITFYSYKGGVGRSLALANTAALLVKRGRRVVLIDFDLEAPGLDSFKDFESIAGQAGVVEYVTEFKTTN